MTPPAAAPLPDPAFQPAARRRRQAWLQRTEAPCLDDPPAKAEGPVRVSLWLPTTILFALLAPFALVFSPFLLLAPPRYRLGPHTVFAVGAVLFSLSGTHIEVEAPDCRVRIHLL